MRINYGLSLELRALVGTKLLSSWSEENTGALNKDEVGQLFESVATRDNQDRTILKHKCQIYEFNRKINEWITLI